MHDDQKTLKAVCGSPDQPLRIGDIEIPCYVLENDKRVLIQKSMTTAMGMKRGSAGDVRGDRLVKFINTKAINPYVSKGLAEVIKEPIKFKTTRGTTAYGYEATVLADLCDAVLECRKSGRLNVQQEHIANRCEILVRGFARVGIIALVDEATGYQYTWNDPIRKSQTMAARQPRDRRRGDLQQAWHCPGLDKSDPRPASLETGVHCH